MPSFRLAGAIILALAAVLLSPETLATAMAKPALAGPVATGLWLFKGTLLLLAVVMGLWERFPFGRGAPLAGVEATAQPTRGEWWMAGGFIAVGAFLRLTDLGTGLWYDEIETLVNYVRLPLGQILTTYDSQNNHLFYSVLARISFLIFGESAWALRLPAALLGIASLWAGWRFARRAGGRVEGMLVLALLTFSYQHVWFSQNARGYTGLLFFTLLGSTAFLELLAGPAERRRRAVAIYAITMALATWTHVTGAFVVMAHVLIWMVLALRGGSRGRMAPLAAIALAGFGSILLYAPVLPQLFTTILTPGPAVADTAWKSPLWMVQEMMQGLRRGLPGGTVTLVAGILVIGCGVASYWRRSRTIVGMLVLPGIVTGIMMFVLAHNLWPRFFFFAAAFALMIAVRGVFVMVRGVLPGANAVPATAALTLVILGSVLGVRRAWGPKQDYEGAAQYVESVRGSDDAVVAVDLTTYPYTRYYRASWPSVDNLQTLEEIERRHRKTWLLYTFPIRLSAVHPDIWHRLQSRYDTAAVFPGTVGGGAVVVMVSQ